MNEAHNQRQLEAIADAALDSTDGMARGRIGGVLVIAVADWRQRELEVSRGPAPADSIKAHRASDGRWVSVWKLPR